MLKLQTSRSLMVAERNEMLCASAGGVFTKLAADSKGSGTLKIEADLEDSVRLSNIHQILARWLQTFR